MIIYYAVLYMTNGEIHLKPRNSEESAEKIIAELKESEWGTLIESTKIVKKDTTTALWVKTDGKWIGA